MIRKTAFLLGVIAGLFSIALWIVLVFYNPYAPADFDETAVNTFIMLVLPAFLAIIACLLNKKSLIFIAFVWSLPISLYMMLTPGIFAWFIVSCAAYFISFLLMIYPTMKEKIIIQKTIQ